MTCDEATGGSLVPVQCSLTALQPDHHGLPKLFGRHVKTGKAAKHVTLRILLLLEELPQNSRAVLPVILDTLPRECPMLLL